MLKHRTSLPSDADLFERFGDYLTKEIGRSPRTAETYTRAVECAARFAGKQATALTSSDVRLLLREGAFAASTKRGIVVAVRSFHSFGVLEGLWETDGGIMAMKTPKVPRAPLAPCDSMTAKKVLASCKSPIDYRIAYLGLYGGLRISESSQITSLHWRNDWLVFIGKGNKKRRVPVHPELKSVQDIILSRQPNRRTMEVTWTRLRDKIGAKDIDGKRATTHSLRRTAATTMYSKGTPWEVVAKVLGHGEDVTASYARISDLNLRDAIHTIDYFDGDPAQLVLFGQPVLCSEIPTPLSRTCDCNHDRKAVL